MKTNDFLEIIFESDRKPNLIGRDDGENFAKKTFKEFLNGKDIKKYSRSI